MRLNKQTSHYDHVSLSTAGRGQDARGYTLVACDICRSRKVCLNTYFHQRRRLTDIGLNSSNAAGKVKVALVTDVERPQSHAPTR